MVNQRILRIEGRIAMLRNLCADEGDSMYDPVLSEMIKNKKVRKDLKGLAEFYEYQLE